MHAVIVLAWPRFQLGKVQLQATQDFQPYASLMPASIQPAARSPPARALPKTTILDSPRCVDSKLVLFNNRNKSPEVSGSKNTVCLPAPIQIFKNNTNIACWRILIKQILFLDLAGGFGSLDEFEVSPVDSD
jgi:hypothetical protein